MTDRIGIDTNGGIDQPEPTIRAAVTRMLVDAQAAFSLIEQIAVESEELRGRGGDMLPRRALAAYAALDELVGDLARIVDDAGSVRRVV